MSKVLGISFHKMIVRFTDDGHNRPRNVNQVEYTVIYTVHA